MDTLIKLIIYVNNDPDTFERKKFIQKFYGIYYYNKNKV